MSDEVREEIVYEDISSSTRKSKIRELNNAVKSYENGALRHIDKVVKAISFIVAIGILLIFTGLAAVLVTLDKIFAAIAVAVFIAGIIFALISLFIIYGLGHTITLCKEILKRL